MPADNEQRLKMHISSLIPGTILQLFLLYIYYVVFIAAVCCLGYNTYLIGY